jgi:hypothetical protein
MATYQAPPVAETDPVATAALAAKQDAATAATDTELAAVQTGLLMMQDGTYAPQFPWGATAAPSLIASRAYYGRFTVPKAMTARSISFGLQVADTANNPVHVGLYAADGTRMATSGATLGMMNAAAPSVRKVTIPDTALAA